MRFMEISLLPSKVKRIEERMREIVADEPFERYSVSIEEAKAIFRK